MPLSGPRAAVWSRELTSATLVGRFTSNTQSVREALSRGTRTAIPSSLPSSSGKIWVMAVAEPVLVGMRERLEARARRRSLCGVSRMDWVLVMSCTVVIMPCRMPMPSWMTLTTGARQLVVQEAAVRMRCRAGSYRWSLTPITTLRASPLTGAATITFLTPALK